MEASSPCSSKGPREMRDSCINLPQVLSGSTALIEKRLLVPIYIVVSNVEQVGHSMYYC